MNAPKATRVLAPLLQASGADVAKSGLLLSGLLWPLLGPPQRAEGDGTTLAQYASVAVLLVAPWVRTAAP